MTSEEIEMRFAKLERTNRLLAEFCIHLIGKIHQLDKQTGTNLAGLAGAIKTPERFNLEDYLAQIRRAEVDLDQFDADLAMLGFKPPVPPPE